MGVGRLKISFLYFTHSFQNAGAPTTESHPCCSEGYIFDLQTYRGQKESNFDRRMSNPPLNTRGRSCNQVLRKNIANHFYVISFMYSIRTLATLQGHLMC